MTILTASEAAAVLRVETTHAQMLNLLPLIDGYIRSATGVDWASLETIPAQAKSAAQLLLVQWFENPGQAGSTDGSHFGLLSVLAQLEAMAARYKVIEGISGSGYIEVTGVKAGDTIVEVVGLVGASGDASANFESVVSLDGYILQNYSGDLSDKYYRFYIVEPMGL